MRPERYLHIELGARHATSMPSCARPALRCAQWVSIMDGCWMLDAFTATQSSWQLAAGENSSQSQSLGLEESSMVVLEDCSRIIEHGASSMGSHGWGQHGGGTERASIEPARCQHGSQHVAWKSMENMGASLPWPENLGISTLTLTPAPQIHSSSSSSRAHTR